MITQSWNKVHPIGIGSWHLWWVFDIDKNGEPHRISSHTEQDDINGVLATLQQWANYVDVCHHYGYGASLSVIGKALSQTLIKREDIWINAKLEDHYRNISEIEDALNRYCQKLHTNYIDSYQIHAPMNHLSHQDVIHTVNQLIDQKKVRYLSVSNLNKEQLLEVAQHTEHLISNEINFNLITRINEENWVIDFCDEHNINIIAYQPLKRNIIAQANYPLLTSLSAKYHKTQNQILINWVCNHRWYNIISKTSNPQHSHENYEALNFTMSNNDYQLLDQFRPQWYQENQLYNYRGNDSHLPKIWKL